MAGRRKAAAGPATASARRCAIYTRKSSEEGLEQAFNSLDAQREACEAYVRSQRHEGWTLLPQRYDDGGISGGTLERPALQALLADIRARKVDLVVVYKVDRLTRSLADFAKIVEVFDAHQASFVSVTQAFNTSTSMGRLTLNMLLSFAQFEREVTGERIRDKIAASKRKGMWMGGTVPLGYQVQERKLVVVEREAEIVRHIYQRYLKLGSVRLLQQQLALEGVRSKVVPATSTRAAKGGVPLARGVLYGMLHNRLYRGEIAHQGQVYPGEHPAIIDPELWERVQAELAHNQVERTAGRRARHPSLLVGLLHDEQGQRMIPSHATKNGKRYRYYVSQPLITADRAAAPAGRRVPASDIEGIVLQRITSFLRSEAELLAELGPRVVQAGFQHQLLTSAVTMANNLNDLDTSEQRGVLTTILQRIELHAEQVDLHLLSAKLLEVLQVAASSSEDEGMDKVVVLTLPAALRRVGMEMKLVVDGAGGPGKIDAVLLRLIVKAQRLRDQLLHGRGMTVRAVAEVEGVTGSYVTRLLRLAFLAPAIVTAIAEGRQPLGLNAAKLMQASSLPLDWQEQCLLLGFERS